MTRDLRRDDVVFAVSLVILWCSPGWEEIAALVAGIYWGNK